MFPIAQDIEEINKVLFSCKLHVTDMESLTVNLRNVVVIEVKLFGHYQIVCLLFIQFNSVHCFRWLCCTLERWFSDKTLHIQA